MDDKMKTKSVFITGMLVTFLLLPSITLACQSIDTAYDDFEIIIRGGFGIHFIILNHGNENVTANFTIDDRIIIKPDERYYHSNGTMFCSYILERAEIWQAIPLTFCPIVATMEAEGKSVERKGISFMYFVYFI